MLVAIELINAPFQPPRRPVKVIQTLVRIQVRKAAAGAVEKERGKQEVVQTAEKPEFITPVLVKDGSGDEEER